MKIKHLAIVFLVAAGCGGGAAQSGETLLDSIRAYNDGLRWERFNNSAALVAPSKRADFIEERDKAADDLKITDYDMIRIANKGENQAKVQVKYSWYLKSTQSVWETHAIQLWQRHGKDWFLKESHRLRGHEMPGLDEPPDDVDADGGEKFDSDSDATTKAHAAKRAKDRAKGKDSSADDEWGDDKPVGPTAGNPALAGPAAR